MDKSCIEVTGYITEATGEITLENRTKIDGAVTDLVRRVIKTEDEMVRKCLIHLGWTPPPKKDDGTYFMGGRL